MDSRCKFFMYIKTDRVPSSNPNPWGVPNLLSSPEYSSPRLLIFRFFFHLGHLYSNPPINNYSNVQPPYSNPSYYSGLESNCFPWRSFSIHYYSMIALMQVIRNPPYEILHLNRIHSYHTQSKTLEMSRKTPQTSILGPHSKGEFIS